MTLNLTEETVPEGYERLVFAEDTESGLQAFICVHSTTLGPCCWRLPDVGLRNA